jgi:4-amino-4-deoxy-L-arabinose transferase-like glycosyltransferase
MARPQTQDESGQHWLWAGYLLIALLLLFRLGYIASGTIELSNDEAYQWLWSKHLALSYFSKPPGIAFIQFAGTALWGECCGSWPARPVRARVSCSCSSSRARR